MISIRLIALNKRMDKSQQAGVGNKLNKQAIKRASKKRQISYLLLITNFSFFFMVSPLVVLNVFKLVEEDSIQATVFYFLPYTNHG